MKITIWSRNIKLLLAFTLCLLLVIVLYHNRYRTKIHQFVTKSASIGASSKSPIKLKTRKTVVKPKLLTKTFKSIAKPVRSNRLLWSSEEEIDYPLAFTLIIYENAERAARLFRLIYRPHNAYCIHIDVKAGLRVESEFRRRIDDLQGKHVLYIPLHDRIDVTWGKYSVLNVTLTCAQTLINYANRVDWHYFFNLNEKELPLRTNWELVQALKAMNGSNSVENDNRPIFQFRYPTVKTSHKFTWIKGSYHVALRRDFVHYALTHPIACELNDILAFNYSFIPDELFFNTLAHNPQLGAPGACLDSHITDPTDSRTWHAARYCDWAYNHQCKSGRSRHSICSLGMGDLPTLMNRPEFFANKFMHDVEPQAYNLLEQWLIAKNSLERDEKRLDPSFNATYYTQLYCSKSHI